MRRSTGATNRRTIHATHSPRIDTRINGLDLDRIQGLVRAADPQVSSLSAAQRSGTKLMDITYTLTSDTPTCTVSVQVSTNNGATYDLPATNFSGSGYGAGVTPGTGKPIVWDAAADWDGAYSTQVWFKVLANDGATPSGFVLIPAGNFIMGGTFDDGFSAELPLHTNYVSAFYMEATKVTKAQWDTVYQWATNHGYAFDNAGSGKATNHPVQTVNWYDVVKWCNARSEMDGLTPCYYTASGQMIVYRTGQTNIVDDCVKWSADGYRSPTEAEWEKAARGGSAGHRFPWSDADTITHSRANYYSSSSYAYDVSPTLGYHPTYATGGTPYTSPVGVFTTNGFGLYDMAGNVWEWCWDWYSSSYYSSSPGSDPHGASSGSTRVLRGGGWGSYAFVCRVANRGNFPPDVEYDYLGLRCARGQPGSAGSAGFGPVTVDTRGASAGPTIKANGTTGEITVNYPETVSVTVEMNADIYAGAEVDWWIVAIAYPANWYYLSPLQWMPFSGALAQCQPVYQGALFDLPSTTVLPAITLPPGTYDFWFAVDYPLDGILDPNGQILFDKVSVVVQ